MVGEALTLRASNRRNSAIFVVPAKGDPVIVAEIKFRQIPMQMLLFTVLIHASHSALKD